MSLLDRAGRALANAATLPRLLGAARDAFEVMIWLSGEQAETDDGLVAAFAGVLAAAADGRDAIAVAPSMPPGCGGAAASCAAAGSAREAASAMAALSAVLASRLDQGSGAASDPRDRAACRRAAGYAREAHGLLAGARP